jgi:hypothetical protein
MNRYDTYSIRKALRTGNPLEALDGFYMDVSKPALTVSGYIHLGEHNDYFFRFYLH